MVYFPNYIWEFIKGEIERKDIYIYIYILLLYHLPFICYFFPFKIEIRLIFHIHFNKGMSVPLTFGRNA